MKGVMFIDKGIARIIDEPKPECTKDTVLLKMIYSAISNGTEMSFLTGGPYGGSWPNRIGYCNVSEVVEVGSEITRFKIGDILFDATFSGHVEYHLVRESDLVVKIPQGMNLKAATMLGTACVPFFNTKLAKVTAEDNVLVFGAGLIGQFACQSVNAKGARAILAEPDEERRKLALRLGAYQAHNPLTSEGWAAIESSKPYTVVMECSGADILDKIIGESWKSGVLADYGRLNLIAGRFDVKYSFAAASSRYMEIIQSTHFDIDTLFTVTRLAEKGVINLEALIKDVLPIDEAENIYAILRDKPSQLLGTVLCW